MTNRRPLILADNPAQVSSGLMPDRHPLMQPLWDLSVNARFYNAKIGRLVPPALMFTPVAGGYPIRGIHQQQESNGVRWVFSALHHTPSGFMYFFKWYGPVATQIGTIAGSVLDQTLTQDATYADFQSWGDWVILNTGVGQPIRYKMQDGSFTALPNSPSGAVAFMKKQNQLLAIGHGLNHKLVSWCSADNLELWAAAAGNSAGQLPIEELDTGIKAAARLGQLIACYAEDQQAQVYWTGAPFYYGQRVALNGIGAVGKAAVCSDGRLNYGVSRNGCWRTDGVDFAYIDAGILSDYLQANVNWDQASKIVVARNDVTRQIEFYFPMQASLINSEGWAFDPTNGGWAPLPAQEYMVERVLFDKPLYGKLGNIYLADDDPTAAGALSLRTKPLTITDPNGRNLRTGARIDELEIMAKAAVGIQFRYLTSEDIDGPWTASAWQDVSPDQRSYELEELPTGIFHALEFKSIISAWSLDLQGFAMFGEAEGGKRGTT